MNFATAESLAPVEGLVNRAGTALAKMGPGASCVVFGPTLGMLMLIWDSVKCVYNKIEDNKRLSEVKLELYKEAIKRQDAIIKVLQKEACLDAARMSELKEINSELIRTIRELKEDLDSAA